jgi:hypothetical protein
MSLSKKVKRKKSKASSIQPRNAARMVILCCAVRSIVALRALALVGFVT